MPLPPERRVRWTRAHRIIPWRYPPVPLFERIADPRDWEALAAVESLTNPRLRDAVGEIRLVPPEDRIAGPGASWVMASFTHVGRPSRFSDGSYGVYYCARRQETAIAETAYHMGRFYAETGEEPIDVDMQVLVGSIDARFHDLRGGARRFRRFHDPDDYTASQALGRTLRGSGSHGVCYDSVRHRGGQCLGAFRPRVVGLPAVRGHLMYRWDGRRIARYFDFARDAWVERE